MKNHDLLPPIIKDLIDDLRKDNSPLHVRDNLCSRLENIVGCASDAIEAFRRKQIKHYTVKQAKQKV